MRKSEIKDIVKEKYGKLASDDKTIEQIWQKQYGCCGADSLTEQIGYNRSQLDHVPAQSDMSLGCGCPIDYADLKEGEVLLDLGSGGGLDCFLAADVVGPKGRVIGIDMTPEMIEKARSNAARGGYKNVEFHPGDIENLPVESESVDVIVSNCVINLTPDKPGAFREAFRILKPGGRLVISDIVLRKELPEEMKQSLEAYIGCVAGASKKEQYLKYLEDQNFVDIKILNEQTIPDLNLENHPSFKKLSPEKRKLYNMIIKNRDNIISATFFARKPEGN